MAAVRADTWICGKCKTINLIATAPDYCPACSHQRDYGQTCCSNPGEPLPKATGLFPGYPEYQRAGYDDLWTCSECGAENHDWCDTCPLCGNEKSTSSGFYEPSEGFRQAPGAGTPADGVWVCPNSNCGCPNSIYYNATCAACGTPKP